MASGAAYVPIQFHPLFRRRSIDYQRWHQLCEKNDETVRKRQDSGYEEGEEEDVSGVSEDECFKLSKDLYELNEDDRDDISVDDVFKTDEELFWKQQDIDLCGGEKFDEESLPAQADAAFQQVDALRIDPDRLWHDIHSTARWGAIPRSMGMARLAASPEDGKVRDWFVHEAQLLGCEIRVDQIGNIFAILPGLRSDVAPIGMGSHLDTQPRGGRFDGILGVIGALEILRTVHESGHKTSAPLAAICWTNEEGAGFLSGCTGSSVWANHRTLEQGQALATTCGSATMEKQLASIGYIGPYPADYRLNPLSCHFEVHIEQGKRLQEEQKRIGVVHGVQGVRWFQVFVHGEQGHAGSTPMADRADAFLATAKLEILLDSLARAKGAVATVGIIEQGEVNAGSSNTIPGSARFTIDLRCPFEPILEDIVAELMTEMKLLEDTNAKLRFELCPIWHSPAAHFDPTMLDCIKHAARVETREAALEMISFAGHDSAMTGLRVPTAMIFVPCKDGVSHAPEEWSTKEQCADGVQVLLQAVLERDRHLAML